MAGSTNGKAIRILFAASQITYIKNITPFGYKSKIQVFVTTWWKCHMYTRMAQKKWKILW